MPIPKSPATETRPPKGTIGRPDRIPRVESEIDKNDAENIRTANVSANNVIFHLLRQTSSIIQPASVQPGVNERVSSVVSEEADQNAAAATKAAPATVTMMLYVRPFLCFFPCLTCPPKTQKSHRITTPTNKHHPERVGELLPTRRKSIM